MEGSPELAPASYPLGMGQVKEIADELLPPAPEHKELKAANDLADILDLTDETRFDIVAAARALADGAPELGDLAETLATVLADPRLALLQRLATERAGTFLVLDEAHRGLGYLDKGDFAIDYDPIRIALEGMVPTDLSPEQAAKLARLKELVKVSEQAHEARAALEKTKRPELDDLGL
jgi:hypothetical protein